MKKVLIFTLTRPAKKGGGDRYEAGEFAIYVPHEISRVKGTPVSELAITFEHKERG